MNKKKPVKNELKRKEPPRKKAEMRLINELAAACLTDPEGRYTGTPARVLEDVPDRDTDDL